MKGKEQEKTTDVKAIKSKIDIYFGYKFRYLISSATFILTSGIISLRMSADVTYALKSKQTQNLILFLSIYSN